MRGNIETTISIGNTKSCPSELLLNVNGQLTTTPMPVQIEIFHQCCVAKHHVFRMSVSDRLLTPTLILQCIKAKTWHSSFMMNYQVEGSNRVDQREGSPAGAPLPNEENFLHSVATDEYVGSYREYSPSKSSLYRNNDAAAYSDRAITGRGDPCAPGRGDSSTTGTELKQIRLSSSSMVDFDEQEWPKEKPKAVSTTEINQAKWDVLFGRLLNYKANFGDCLVPNRYDTDPSLGAWVSTQLR